MNLIRTELLRFFREAKVYFPDTIVNICTSLLLFIMMFLNNPAISITSYMLWIVSQSILSEASVSISVEKQLGTLQNIMIKPYNLLQIILARILVWMLSGIGRALLFLLLILPFAGWQSISLPHVLLVYALTSLGMTGPGLIVASATLIYTKTASFESILNYLLLAVSGIFIPVPEWMKFTNPLSAGVECLNNTLQFSNLMVLTGVSLIWMAAGILVFHLVFRRAKEFRWTY